MHEFETFVYLDMEKTGSRFITQLLREFCVEKEIRRTHHGRMEAGCNRSKFYFMSVRHPLDTYISLYSFGTQFSGKVRAQFRDRGLNGLYDGTSDGFNKWLSHVLRPRFAETLGEGYAKFGDGSVARLIGLQSYRFIQLAMPDAGAVLAKCGNRDAVRNAYAAHKLPSYFVRHESFGADLRALLSGKLRHAISDVDKALRFLDEAKPANASKRVDAENADFAVRRALMELLREREWFLYEEFGYLPTLPQAAKPPKAKGREAGALTPKSSRPSDDATGRE